MGTNVALQRDRSNPADSFNLVACCVEAAQGHSDAALLLQRVRYWMPKAKRRIGPYIWIAKSGAEWCAESGLTPKQYKVALAELKRLGLVVTEQHCLLSAHATSDAGRPAWSTAQLVATRR